MEKIYKECLPTITKICWRYSLYFKIDYNDLFSKSNELFISIYKKYTYEKIPFKKFLYIQLNNYLKKYCSKEILRKQREKIICYNSKTYSEIKIKETQELSEISKKILDYCIEQNSKKEMQYQKVLYKNKIYSYPTKIKSITMKNIKEYFLKLYEPYQINEAISEIRYILKKELI